MVIPLAGFSALARWMVLRYQQRWSRTTAVEGCVHAIISIILLDIPRTEVDTSLDSMYVRSTMLSAGSISDKLWIPCE